ncbi:MAG: hypothetical protein JXA49_03220 [Actinobacteria bacterium]|nr:hypothetical protein [Actinomycetota bacterium]
MGYKLIKDESTQISKKKIKAFRAAKYISGFTGACLMFAGAWMIAGVERKIHDRFADPSFDSTSTIAVSLLLIAVGLTLVLLSYYFQRKGSSERAFLRGTDQYWVNAYTRSGEPGLQAGGFPPPPDERPVNPFLEEISAPSSGNVTGVAFCPHCKKIVEMKSGICIECGNPFITKPGPE